jgi:formate dehydrogenase (coenzyme F420) beta subunit
MMNTAKKITVPASREESYAAATEEIHAAAVHLLEAGTVAAVVGYRAGRRKGTALPFIATTPEQAAELIFSPGCHHNLALYLSRKKKEVRKLGRLAVVVKGCDQRAVAALIGENQLQREEVVLVGVACAGVTESRGLDEGLLLAKCRQCRVQFPEGADQVVGSLPEPIEAPATVTDELARLEALSPAERWSFWKEHFSRCTRCYACRQVCPLCYCEQCLCDRNRPQAVESTPRPAGNMAWHLVRAMHLAGRCASCAECERSCPSEIPLHLLNRKMAKELKELFDHEAGLMPVAKGPLHHYREDDDQSFIR